MSEEITKILEQAKKRLDELDFISDPSNFIGGIGRLPSKTQIDIDIERSRIMREIAQSLEYVDLSTLPEELIDFAYFAIGEGQKLNLLSQKRAELGQVEGGRAGGDEPTVIYTYDYPANQMTRAEKIEAYRDWTEQDKMFRPLYVDWATRKFNGTDLNGDPKVSQKVFLGWKRYLDPQTQKKFRNR